MAEPVFIVELTKEQIELVGALGHLYLRHNPEDEVAQDLIDVLVEQTNSAYNNPALHGIGIAAIYPGNPTAVAKGYEVERHMASINLTNVLLYEMDA